MAERALKDGDVEVSHCDLVLGSSEGNLHMYQGELLQTSGFEGLEKTDV